MTRVIVLCGMFVVVALGMIALAAEANPPYNVAAPSYTPATGGSVIVPAYGAVYNQPSLSQADGKRIIELLESIDRKLSVGGGGPIPQALPGVDVLKVAQKSCARCHTPGIADDKGGGFVLFADDTAKAFKPVNKARRSEENRLIRDEVITRGTMPKGGKLTPAEKSAFEFPIFK